MNRTSSCFETVIAPLFPREGYRGEFFWGTKFCALTEMKLVVCLDDVNQANPIKAPMGRKLYSRRRNEIHVALKGREYLSKRMVIRGL